MKIAFFSPLNPVQSGISDYSEELLLAMYGARADGAAVDIDLFTGKGYKPTNTEITRRFNIYQGRNFGRVASEYSSAIYQMGNSPPHAYIYEEALHHPGVVVMHEFVLHHLRQWMALNHGKRKAYLALMERQYGEEGREAARRVMLGQYPEALFNFPLSDESIMSAQGIIVHSHYMESLVKGVRADVPLSVVPMGVPLPVYIPKEVARARLSIDPATFLITSVGHLNPYKRVSATLRAFKALLMEVPNSIYLLVGSRSPNYDPTRQIDMLGLTGRVKTTGYVSQEDFAYYLAASDVCLNLRHPTAGETSASLLRIMGAGVPVLVSRTGSFEELPDEAVGKIDVGGIEEDLLLEYLLLLARRPDIRAAMSEAARSYVVEHHTLEGEARGYLEFLLSLEKSRGKVAAPGEITLSGEGIAVLKREQAIEVPPPAVAVSGSLGEPEKPVLPDYDPLSVVAEAAAELGVGEGDEAVLAHLARSLEGLV